MNIQVYMHSPVLPLALGRDTAFDHGQWLVRRLLIGVLRINAPPTPGPREYYARWDRKIL